MTAQASHASVLLIEDNRDIAEMVGSYLEMRGYEFDYAADGVTGLHLAVVNEYDAIVLDLMLPGMDGLSVCRKLREEARRDTPLLMLTARDTLDESATFLRFYEASLNAYTYPTSGSCSTGDSIGDEHAARIAAVPRTLQGMRGAVAGRDGVQVEHASDELDR